MSPTNEHFNSFFVLTIFLFSQLIRNSPQQSQGTGKKNKKKNELIE